MKLIKKKDLIGNENCFYCGVLIKKRDFSIYHISAVTGEDISKIGFQFARSKYKDIFEFYLNSKNSRSSEDIIETPDGFILGVKHDTLLSDNDDSLIFKIKAEHAVNAILTRLKQLGDHKHIKMCYYGYLRKFEEDINGID